MNYSAGEIWLIIILMGCRDLSDPLFVSRVDRGAADAEMVAAPLALHAGCRFAWPCRAACGLAGRDGGRS